MPQVSTKVVHERSRTVIEYINNDTFVYSVAGVAIIAGAVTGTVAVPTVLTALSVLSTAKTGVKIAKATAPILCTTANSAGQMITPLFNRISSKTQTYQLELSDDFEVIDENGNLQEIHSSKHRKEHTKSFDVLDDQGNTLETYTPSHGLK